MLAPTTLGVVTFRKGVRSEVDPGSGGIELGVTIQAAVGEFVHPGRFLSFFRPLGITDGAGRVVTFSAWH
jgi:hypothetical protein